MAATPTNPRYRLRRPLAVAWRGDGVLQLGLDTPGLVLDGVPAGLDAAVTALHQARSIAELGYLVPGVPRPWLLWLVDQLGAAGLLLPDREPLATLGVVGSGPLAEATTAMLAQAGLPEVTRIAHHRPPARPSPGESPLLPAVHWSQVGAGWPSLTVVATDTQEPDRALTDALLAAGRAHLVVRLEADRAIVGPLVLPGTTPCIRCQDLLRCRYDAAWPLLVAQLCRDRPTPDPVLLAWAATTAAVQARCHLTGGEPDVTGRTLELGGDHTLRTRDWPVHPECGCILAAA